MSVIELESPASIKLKAVKNQISKLANDGVESKDIILMLHFCATEDVCKDILNNFRKLKNKIYFEKDFKNRL